MIQNSKKLLYIQYVHHNTIKNSLLLHKIIDNCKKYLYKYFNQYIHSKIITKQLRE